MRNIFLVALVVLSTTFPGKVMSSHLETEVVSTNYFMEGRNTFETDLILRAAGTELGYSLEEMQHFYLNGQVTINELGTHTFEVVIVSGGISETIITDVYF